MDYRDYEKIVKDHGITLEELGILFHLFISQNPAILKLLLEVSEDGHLPLKVFPGFRKNSKIFRFLISRMQEKGLLKVVERKGGKFVTIELKSTICEERKEEKDEKPIENWKAPDFVKYFSHLFRETYGVDYLANYGKDGKIIRRLLDEYKLSPQQLHGVITVLFQQNKGFVGKVKITSISSLSASWVVNALLVQLKEVQENQKKKSEYRDWESLKVRAKREEKEAINVQILP